MAIGDRLLGIAYMISMELIEGAENWFPLEKRLRWNRERRARQLKKVVNKTGPKAGKEARMMAMELTETQADRDELQAEMEQHLANARDAQMQGKTAIEQAEMAAAAGLADNIAETEQWITELEAMVNEAFGSEERVIAQILEARNQLKRLGFRDRRLVSRSRSADVMQILSDLEMSVEEGLIPDDAEDIRARAETQVNEKVAEAQARQAIIRALANDRQRGQVSTSQVSSSRARDILRQAQEKAGYAPAIGQEPFSVEDGQEVAKQTRRLTND